MDRFKALQTFLDVAKTESLSAVARDEGVTPAMVGRRIDQLEHRLDVKLFKRSTRKITLTQEGSAFFESIRNILDDLAAAEETITVGAKNATGRLIVSAPTAFGRKHIAPHVPAFIRENPNLTVTLQLSERIVDLKNERVDVAIRIADLKNADLIAIKLARNHRVVVGAPSYIKRAGKPQTLADLSRHNCLVTSSEDGLADVWQFQEKGDMQPVKVAGNMHCNDGAVLTKWAIAGEGLAWRSAWEVADEIANHRLVELLPKFSAPGNDIYAVYPDRKFLPAKVRLFIEFMKHKFGDPPYWERASHKR
jgi:DNA-binding transcriptional LysR family regulator